MTTIEIAKNLLLGQTCDNCIFRNNPYRAAHVWCFKHVVDSRFKAGWCNCWVTDKIYISGYHGIDSFNFNEFVRHKAQEMLDESK